MEKYYISCRSLTEAQRMQKLLERAGVRSAVARLPSDLSEGGCGYALRLNRRIAEAAETLRMSGNRPGKVYVTSGDGKFREVVF